MLGRGTIESVLLNESAYGDCTATLDVNLSITPDTDGTANGVALIDIINLRGEEDRCPVPSSDPCQIQLILRAQQP